jgi:hypothetical protein
VEVETLQEAEGGIGSSVGDRQEVETANLAYQALVACQGDHQGRGKGA